MTALQREEPVAVGARTHVKRYQGDFRLDGRRLPERQLCEFKLTSVVRLHALAARFILHVPYRGTGPQLTDLIAGRLDAASVGAPAVMQFIKTGKLRCIATGTITRIAQLPHVPTVAEQGFPGFEMTQWYGLLAPASLPQPAVDKLAVAAAAAVRQPASTEKFSADAAIAVGGTPAEFAAFIAVEQQRWKAVIARAKIKPD